MDPLSIAGSIAGLVTLAAGVIQVVDGLFKDLKSTPEVLILISQQTTSLRTVLDRFEPGKAGLSVADSEGLALAVSGCRYVLERIGKVATELRLTQGKRTIQKSFMSVVVSSKLKELTALEDKLERFKSTLELILVVELHELHQVTISAQDLRKDIEELRRSIERRGSSTYAATVGLETGKIAHPSFGEWLAQWEHEADLDDGITEDEELMRISQYRKESTLYQKPQARDIPIRQGSESNTSCHKDDTDFGTDFLAAIPEATRRVRAVDEGVIHLVITDLKKHGSDRAYTEEIHTTPGTEQYKVIQALCNKGYVNVCGFQDIGSQTMLSPILPHESPFAVTVTDGPSCYDIMSGLKISENERLIDFYNKFIMDKPLNRNGPLSAVRNAYDVMIRDERKTHPEELKIEFKRTLRVPEDGEVYSNPAFFGSFPLYSVQAMRGRLPSSMQRKGGVFFPMLQREALAISFAVFKQKMPSDERYAVRVFAGSINCITGQPESHSLEQPLQDYIVVPKIRRLDGFRTGLGRAAQFVAMPLGFNYSVEKQVIGREYIGGVQFQIAPSLCTSVHFYRSAYNPPGFRFRLKCIENGLDLYHTPHELGFSNGERIFMEEIVSKQHDPRTRRMTFGQHYLMSFGDMNLQKCGNFPFDSYICRPTFVHELFTQRPDAARPINQSLILQPVEPMEISVDWEAFGVERTISTERYSPFMHLLDLKKNIQYTALQRSASGIKDGALLVNGSRYYKIDRYAPLIDNGLDGAVISLVDWEVCPAYTGGVHLGDDQKELEQPRPSVSYPTTKAVSWEMALGAGGSLNQRIERTSNPLIWDWKQACFLNVQILNAIAFQEMTGVAPISPLSFSDYRKAGLPFYGSTKSGEEADIPEAVFTALTVSELDSSKLLRIDTRLKKDGPPTGCALCEVNLCNNILMPCVHTFCSDCVKSKMTDAVGEIECICCEARCVRIVIYAAPMELPIVKREDAAETTNSAEKESKNLFQDLLHLLADQFSTTAQIDIREASVWSLEDPVTDQVDRQLTLNMILTSLMRADLPTRLKALEQLVVSAHRIQDHEILGRVLALVPNVDDVVDIGLFPKLISRFASKEESFIAVFRWITKGSRSFSQLGIPLSELVKHALTSRSDTCMSLIVEEAKRRRIPLSNVGISAYFAQNSSSWNRHKLSLLLRHGADPNELDKDGRTCLHKADDAPSITEQLLEAGARVEIQDCQGRTAIHLAVEKRWTSRLAPLLRSESGQKSINIRDKSGRTALDIAGKLPYQYASVFTKMLLDAGADPDPHRDVDTIRWEDDH